MKRALLFVSRYIASFIIPTVYLVIRYNLYKSRAALYVVGIASVAIVGIAVCKWLAHSENNTIPRQWAYIPSMLRFPCYLLITLLAVKFAGNYGKLLTEILYAYLIGCSVSVPLTVAYNRIVWTDYRANFGK